jgi:hypothetical protein
VLEHFDLAEMETAVKQETHDTLGFVFLQIKLISSSLEASVILGQRVQFRGVLHTHRICSLPALSNV